MSAFESPIRAHAQDATISLTLTLTLISNPDPNPNPNRAHAQDAVTFRKRLQARPDCPTECHPIAMAQEKFKTNQRAIFAKAMADCSREDVLMRFYTRMLQLFSTIVLNNPDAITFMLQHQRRLMTSFEELMDIAACADLPSCIRSSCISLLQTMFVEKDPFAQLCL